MEALCFSEMSDIDRRTTRCYAPSRRYENLKSKKNK
jgi:hypothetical protein